jgi:hypothetical protein
MGAGWGTVEQACIGNDWHWLWHWLRYSLALALALVLVLAWTLHGMEGEMEGQSGVHLHLPAIIMGPCF